VSSFVETKTYSQGWALPPEILAQTDLPPPDSSESWHVLPCSASTVRDRKRSSITLNKKSTQAFQQAINQGSTPPLLPQNGDQITKFVVFGTISTIKDEKSAAKFHYRYIKKVSLYKNCQRHSCSAINCLSSGINILAGGSIVPLISEHKGTDPHWKQVRCLFLFAFSRQHDHLSAVVLWRSVVMHFLNK